MGESRRRRRQYRLEGVGGFCCLVSFCTEAFKIHTILKVKHAFVIFMLQLKGHRKTDGAAFCAKRRPRVRNGGVHVSVTAWWEKHANVDRKKKMGTNTEADGKVSISGNLPITCHHPQAPRDSPSHPTQREEEVKGGEEEKEKTRHTCEACHIETRLKRKDNRERHYSTETVITVT